MTLSTITRPLKRVGRGMSMTLEQKNEIIESYNGGEAVQSIAERHNRSRQAIYRILHLAPQVETDEE